MERFNITLPLALKYQLKAEASERNTKPSRLIVEYVQEHCIDTKTDCQQQHQASERKLSEAKRQSGTVTTAPKRQLKQEQELAAQKASRAESPAAEA